MKGNHNKLTPRYIMIGGFLGSGKTTTIIQLANWLKAKNIRAGLISNDQSTGLVDTALVRSKGFAIEEIPGGCFCCKFSSLVEAAQKLTTQSTPDVFIAEPVGSCTDLVATVSYPLRRMYGDQYVISPLSVMLDPVRAARILDLEPGPKFSPKVVYVYEKQLEEANFIVINKSDIASPELLQALTQKLNEKFNPQEIFICSARNNQGLDAWFERLMSDEIQEQNTMNVNYDDYADGEALLGWLNATIQLKSTQDVDGNALLEFLGTTMQHKLLQESIEVAHLKMTLIPNEGFGDIASINLVRNDLVPELSELLHEPLQQGQLVINIRAESASTRLREITESSLHACAQHYNISLPVEHLEHFQPAKPTPEHRIINTI